MNSLAEAGGYLARVELIDFQGRSIEKLVDGANLQFHNLSRPGVDDCRSLVAAQLWAALFRHWRMGCGWCR